MNHFTGTMSASFQVKAGRIPDVTPAKSKAALHALAQSNTGSSRGDMTGCRSALITLRGSRTVTAC